MRETHSIAKTIVKLMVLMSELVIIMGRYIGIYAKDSLDELLLISHQSSSYKGKSRKIERKAISEWIDWIKMENKELGYYEVEVENGIKEIEIERSEVENEMSKPNGDNFPYIRGHSNPY